MKRFASGEPAQKKVRFEEGSYQIQDQVHVLGAAKIRRRPVFKPKETPQRKTGGLKRKGTRQKSASQALDDLAERYDFLNSLARAPARISFCHIANGDVDKVRKELRKIIAKKVTRSAVNVASEDGQRKVPPNRHQVVTLLGYSEPVYGRLDSGAISNVMPGTLAERFRMNLYSTKSRIVVADGSTGDCAGVLE